MKERPIIFSGDMVRAILEGRKTQTRRVVKPQPWPVETVDTERHVIVSHPDKLRVPPCPYGQPGDRLWVRETWALLEHPLGLASPSYCIDAVYKASVTDHYPLTNEVGFEVLSTKVVASSADQNLPDGSGKFSKCTGSIKGLLGSVDRWRPSIHMPRWASRILLEVTDIRVERVQDISAEDAMAEGADKTEFWTPKELDIRPFEEKWWDDFEFWNRYPPMVFQRLWDSINAKRGHGWDTNPWVWVVTFKRIEP